MNRCVRFTKIKLGALHAVEIKALPTAQPSLFCEYVEDCLFLYVDDADDFIKCLVRAICSNKATSSTVMIVDRSDHEILWNIANSGCTIYKDSFGLWMNELNAFRYANSFRTNYCKHGGIFVSDLTNIPGHLDGVYQYGNGILIRRKKIGGMYFWFALAPFEPETILDTDICIGWSENNSDKIELLDNRKQDRKIIEEYFSEYHKKWNNLSTDK